MREGSFQYPDDLIVLTTNKIDKCFLEYNKSCCYRDSFSVYPDYRLQPISWKLITQYFRRWKRQRESQY